MPGPPPPVPPLHRPGLSFLFRMQLPAAVKVALVEALADTEHRLAFSTSERLQLGGLVAAFVRSREAVARAAKPS